MNTSNFLSYDELQKLLDNNQYLITVAELQGLLMGFYSAGLIIDDNCWRKLLLKQLSVSEPIPQVIECELVAINASLCEMISSNLLNLELLLPDDDSSIVARGEALGYWCQGFVLGYFQLIENKDEADDDVVEAIDDLEEISNIDLDSITESEADDKLLFQISEHIKVAAQLIHSTNGQKPTIVNETLH